MENNKSILAKQKRREETLRLLVFLFITFSLFFAYNWYLSSLEVRALERGAMFGTEVLNKENYLEGYYLKDRFFCVWTKDTKYDDISSTYYHEMSHDFVYNDSPHFCGEYCGNITSLQFNDSQKAKGDSNG